MKSKAVGAIFTETTILLLAGFAIFLVHMFTNNQYGFHQDEMVVLDNAYHLDWGYVEYPPFTPFITRIALDLFGLSLVSARSFAALAQSIVIVLAGLMTRELGGRRLTQLVAAIAAAIAPIALAEGATVMYVTFDFLWSVLIAYFTIRLLKTDNPRWWLGIGIVIGLGMMTKFTMAFFVAGLVGGIILTKARRYLTNAWLWGGVALSLLIFLPNLIWQVQHNFISLDFLNGIHARDVEIGRAQGYILEQFVFCASLFVIPFWVAGLYYFFFKEDGKRYRALGWMYVIPFVIYFVAQGRSYYLAPAYPMLIAAGTVSWQGWLNSLSAPRVRFALAGTWSLLGLGAVLSGAIALPIAPIGSTLWNVTSGVHDLFTEQIGWPDMVKMVAGIYADLPPGEQDQTGILTQENDEASALNLYGSEYGLPKAISGSDTFWLRGYGNPPPETLIVLGMEPITVSYLFEECDLAGTITNPYGVENDLRNPPEIFICRRPRLPWPEFWERLKHYS